MGRLVRTALSGVQGVDTFVAAKRIRSAKLQPEPLVDLGDTFDSASGGQRTPTMVSMVAVAFTRTAPDCRAAFASTPPRRMRTSHSAPE